MFPHPSINYCSSSLSISTRRRPMRELSISMFDHPYEGRKIKVVKEGIMRSKIQGVSEEGDHQNGDQLLYQVDYHGVTTHPTPTPKHPKP
ncbi:hypothetical protein HHK36_013551 [Tetracentron sinense]|uniref:Uncharacterized protein n=1 Tax=Tetracentron sinense TaxID=13715 RepID=A0A834Z2A7_TETSI|nr:hypothetical protein HHK36_013551 [Tetracentron sinense]